MDTQINRFHNIEDAQKNLPHYILSVFPELLEPSLWSKSLFEDSYLYPALQAQVVVGTSGKAQGSYSLGLD